MTAARVLFATPYLDQMYSAVTASWNLIWPRPVGWVFEVGAYLPTAHNVIVKRALERDDWDRLLIIEQDIVVMHPGLVSRVRTQEADIVSGTVVARRPPHWPMIYEETNSQGEARAMAPQRSGPMLEKPREHAVAAVSTSLVSIKRWVVEQMEPPWFEPSPGQVAVGEFGGHDFWFCHKAKAMGASVAWDTDESVYAPHAGFQLYRLEDFVRELQREMAGMEHMR